jgi:hypothetical protein
MHPAENSFTLIEFPPNNDETVVGQVAPKNEARQKRRGATDL